jgi:hypothetical protein
MFGGRRIVPARQMAEIHTPHSLSSPPATPDSRSGFYGLGFNVSDDWTGRVRLSHSGAFALGAGTNFVLLPSEHLGIVVLTNGIPIGAAEAVSATFMDLAETGRVERDWYPAYHGRLAPMLENHGVLAGRRPPEHPRRARPARAYAGTYANRYYGPARITARRGRLTMHLGPRGRGYRLRHWSGNTFSYMPPGENAPGITAVRFRMRHGRAASVWLENLDAEGLGTFTRR